MAIETTFDGFQVADLHAAARRAMETTAREMERFDTAVDATGRTVNAGYQVQTGELIGSYESQIEDTLEGPVLVYKNTAPHAVYVNDVDGISVMPSVDSGYAERVFDRELDREIDR